MEYENDMVFSYVNELLMGRRGSAYSIRMFADKHNHIGPKLKELKDIIISYYHEKSNDLLNSVLFDIINCEQDLNYHCQVEDSLFVPAVEELERAVSKEACDSTESIEQQTEKKNDALSAREKEIIACIAKGMSNKEIAEELNLSVHTVTTHRRNLSAKLQIHSPAGLTIYAIVNKLINLQDIQGLKIEK